jgi:endoglucanase Acf2
MLDKILFVSTEVQEKKVTLPDGSVHSLYFKELPAVEFRRFAIAEQSDNDDIKACSLAKLISVSLCDADGKPAITFDQALQLKASAMTAIFEAMLEVNGQKKA